MCSLLGASRASWRERGRLYTSCFLLLGGEGPQPWFHALQLMSQVCCRTQVLPCSSDPKDVWLLSMEQVFIQLPGTCQEVEP